MALYCNGKPKESLKLLKNIPPIDEFTKKTSNFINFKIVFIMESNNFNNSFLVDIPNYNGPLEILLELAKNQKLI